MQPTRSVVFRHPRGNLINDGTVDARILDNVEFDQGAAPAGAIVR